MTDVESIIREHIKLTYFTINEYFPNYSKDDDVKQIALIALWKAVEKFDKEKDVSFSTFAITVIKNEIFNYLKTDKEFKYKIVIISLDNDFNLSRIENPLLLQQVLSSEIDLQAFFENLSGEEKEICFYISQGIMQTIIAEKLNLSQSTITRRLANIRRKLEKELERNQVFKYSR